MSASRGARGLPAATRSWENGIAWTPQSLGTNLLTPHFDFRPPEVCGNFLLLSPGKLILRSLDRGHMAPPHGDLVSKYKFSVWSTVGMSRPAAGQRSGVHVAGRAGSQPCICVDSNGECSMAPREIKSPSHCLESFSWGHVCADTSGGSVSNVSNYHQAAWLS